MIVGCVVGLLAPTEYHAVGGLRFSAAPRACRGELLQFLWDRELQEPGGPKIRVEAGTDPAHVKLHVRTRGLHDGPALLAARVQSFAVVLQERADEWATDTSLAESVLYEIIDELSTDVTTQRRRLESLDAKPLESAASRREEILARLDEESERLRQLRDQDATVREELAALDRTPLPEKGWVPAADRQAAYADREELQQDLEQLKVEITVAQRRLEEVWQQAAPHLDELIAAAWRVVRLAPDPAGPAPAIPLARAAELLRHSAMLYQRRLSNFASQWDQAFSRLRRQPMDPHAPLLFSTHAELHKLLGDFRHHAAKLLEQMRDDVRQITAQTGIAAEHQPLISDAARSFQTIEARHRQFEFAAAELETPGNFRLDAALRAARNLHHRVRTQVDEIDGRLEAEALEKAVVLRGESRRRFTAQLDALRQDANDAVTDLVALQGRLRELDPMVAEEISQSVRREERALEFARAQTSLRNRRQQRERITLAREAPEAVATVTLESTSVTQSITGRCRRAGCGIVAATGVLMATGPMARGRLRRIWSRRAGIRRNYPRTAAPAAPFRTGY